MRAIVVGAGICGLVAARTLVGAGHAVTVVDKGRSPGGRLATRRINEATLDHGAQFFTVRSDDFARMTHGWLAEGVVREWCRGIGQADGPAHYVGRDGMNGIAKHLARGLDVHCNTMAFAIRPRSPGWELAIDDGTSLHGDVLVAACPLPQAISLLVTAEVEMPADLAALPFDRVLGLLAVLDGPSAVPSPGAVMLEGPQLSWVADNRTKGVSAVPALTLHATADWSLSRWDGDRAEVHRELVDAAQPWFGRSRLVASQVKRWRLGWPVTTWHEPFWSPPDARAPLLVAGDAFGGPNIEGAVRSGLAAARAVLA